MFQTDEYFKSFPVTISHDIINDITVFCHEVLAALSNVSIQKFTVVLDSVDPINVIINNDIGRNTTNTLLIDTIFGKTKIDITSIQNINYSSIPIVYISGNKKYLKIVNKIKKLFLRLLPNNYFLSANQGSLYIIVSKDVIGQLWNIHSDPLVSKAHLVLTDCDEYFVWYPKDKDKFIKKLSANNFYLFNVAVNHTVFIKNYFNNLRIHIVGDLEYVKNQSN